MDRSAYWAGRLERVESVCYVDGAPPSLDERRAQNATVEKIREQWEAGLGIECWLMWNASQQMSPEVRRKRLDFLPEVMITDGDRWFAKPTSVLLAARLDSAMKDLERDHPVPTWVSPGAADFGEYVKATRARRNALAEIRERFPANVVAARRSIEAFPWL